MSIRGDEARAEENESVLMDLTARKVMVFFLCCLGRGVSMVNSISLWSEIPRSEPCIFFNLRPEEQTRSNVWPCLWVGKSMC